MPHRSAPNDDGIVSADAITQVLIARTRESVCEAGVETDQLVATITLSARVDGTELFVITPDTTDLHALGPAATSVVALDGKVFESAWDGRHPLSPQTPSHAVAYRTSTASAIASHADHLVTASSPADALRGLAVSLDADNAASSPSTGQGSGSTPRVTDPRSSSSHPTKE